MDNTATEKLIAEQFGDRILPGYGIVVFYKGEFSQWGEPIKITAMADLGVMVLDCRCVGAKVHEYDPIFVVYREAIDLIVKRYISEPIIGPVAKRIRMSPIKLSVIQFCELIKNLEITKEQLSMLKIGGIFRIAFRVEDINYACETTARNEQSAFLCVGFGR